MTCIADTASINLTVAAGQLSADLVVDPGAGLAPNLVTINPQGVYVIGSDGWIPLPSTLAFSSADGHMFVATSSADLRSFIGPGDKIRLVQSGVPGYFFVHAITATQIWLYGGQLYTLAATPVSTPYFSKVKSPIGFPPGEIPWSEELVDTSNRSQASPVGGTWYNVGSLTLAFPIGLWIAMYSVMLLDVRTAADADMLAKVTLSTANNSESNTKLTSTMEIEAKGRLATEVLLQTAIYKREPLANLAVKTSMFLNAQDSGDGASSIQFRGATAPTIIRAICAYL